MRTNIFLLTILGCLLNITALAQKRTQQTFLQFFNEIAKPDTTRYRVEYTDFVDPIGPEELSKIKHLRTTPDSLIIVDRRIDIYDCRFLDRLMLYKIEFRKRVSIVISPWVNRAADLDEVSSITMSHNIFRKGLTIHILKGDIEAYIGFSNNSVHQTFRLFTENTSSSLSGNSFAMTSRNFDKELISDFTPNSPKLIEKRQEVNFYCDHIGRSFAFEDNNLSFAVNDTKDYLPTFSSYLYINARDITFSRNTISSKLQLSDSLWLQNNAMKIILQDKATSFTFIDNTIQPDLHLSLGFSLNTLRFHGNKLRRIGFDNFKIADQTNIVQWSDLKNASVGIKTESYGDPQPYYSGLYKLQIEDKLAYRELLKFYKKFYDDYKSGGDIRSSNDVYVRIKDLETAELRSSYHDSPSFNLFIRVKLNQLLKYYTAYGTDPAQAIVASFWIIFVFAIFYFFFPSTWDITSKSKLLENFKDFIEKNEKGYVKPFLRMAGGFAISLTNALTLSLNAFVTLGFGEIPTKGVAKYVTVVQGFIGWFLLSIFTVSLVSQLLF